MSALPRTCTAADGVNLEAELAVADTGRDGEARAAVLLCHPHPQYGGTMRSGIIGSLFDALPHAGATTLRFNFRGVEGSGGNHDGGAGELLDVLGALDALTAEVDPAVPIVVAGWSFGGDMALATYDDRVAAWLAFAPPLRLADHQAVARDDRAKMLVLAQHDEFRDPADVVAETEHWENTEVDIVSGASHFFVGRYDRVVEIALDFVAHVTA
ncbi:MAG: alpha/beta family hydrolase [Acidimicrobiia bacterium]